MGGPLNAAATLRSRVVATAQDREFFYDVADSSHRLVHGVLDWDVAPSTTLSLSATRQSDDVMRAMVESAAGSTNVISSATGTDVVSEMADPTSVGTGQFGLQEQARPPFKVVFKDGSSVVIRVDRDHGTDRQWTGCPAGR